MAGTAGFVDDSVITRIAEADVIRGLSIEERVRTYWRTARDPVLQSPCLREERLDMRTHFQIDVFGIRKIQLRRGENRGISAVAVRATEYDRFVLMHRLLIGREVTTHAAGRLRVGLLP